MPTIPELPNAVGTGLQDEIPVSQGGVTRSVTIAELMSGAQPLIEIPSPSVLGRASLGPGGPEALATGAGLAVQATSLVANGTDHLSFIQQQTLGPADEIIVNYSGIPKRTLASSLRSLFSSGPNVRVDSSGVISASTDSAVTGSLTALSQGVVANQVSISSLASKIPAGGYVSLNSGGQVTAPVAGDVSLGLVTNSGATSRTLASRTLDTLNLLDFGGIVGGVDCSPAFSSAFAQLPQGGGEIWVPSGDYWLNSTILLSGKPVAIRGAGKGITRLHIRHTGVGFDIAPGNVLSKVLLSGFSLYAENATGQTAAGLRIAYPSVSAFGYVSVSINEIELFGYPNAVNGQAPFPQTFLRGLVLNNCWSSQVSCVSWFGPPAAANSTNSAVIELNGSVDTRLQSIQAYYGNAVVLQTGYCEGIYLSNPLVVGTDYLVRQTDETHWAGYTFGKPMLLGLWVSNGEINTNVGTVQLSNVTDGFFADLDITRDGGPNTQQVFFDLTNVSNFHVRGCNFVGGPSGGGVGDIAFQFKSTFNSSSNIIDSCHFENMATVLYIVGSNGTVGLTTYGLHFANIPLATAIIDQSSQESGNYISFISPSQPGVPAGLANAKDYVVSGSNGALLFRVNNIANAANFIRHQPGLTNKPPTLCFDGSDGAVDGVIQTKGGNLFVNAAGGNTGSGNLVSLINVVNATNWVVLQNSPSGGLSLVTTNAGGLGIQPKGALWLSPSGGLFMPNLPTTKPTSGSGQVWNNGGILSVA